MAADRAVTGLVCFSVRLCYVLVVVDWANWRDVMREIKFRAWNGRDFIADYYNHNHFISIKDGKLIQVEHDDVCAEGAVYGKPESVVLQQYTGLKDINGVEIYEGDYVSIFTRDDNEYMMCGVVKFGFRGYPGFDIYTRGGNTYSDEYNTFTNDDDLYFKVVGNIYQNPELLK